MSSKLPPAVDVRDSGEICAQNRVITRSYKTRSGRREAKLCKVLFGGQDEQSEHVVAQTKCI